MNKNRIILNLNNIEFIKKNDVIINPLKHFEEDLENAVKKVNKDFPQDIYISKLEIECNEVVNNHIRTNNYSNKESEDLRIIASRIMEKYLN